MTENSTGDEVFSLSLPVSRDGQLSSQTVTLPDLELDSVRYRITVSATNQVGTGPYSTPIFVGTGTQPPKSTVDTSYLLPLPSTDAPSVESSRQEKDDAYYTARILPPLLGVVFIVVVVVVLLVFCRRSRGYRLRRKGLYRCEQ